MIKTADTVEKEIIDYVTKLKKDRGGVKKVEVKLNKDFYPKAIYPDVVVGAFVTFGNGERKFVYRYENAVNNFANGKGYGMYSSYNSEAGVREVVIGWNTVGDSPPWM